MDQLIEQVDADIEDVAAALFYLLETNDFVKVVAQKKNGEDRVFEVMRDIPEDKMPKGTGRERPENMISVFDGTVGDWRTLNLDKVSAIYGKGVHYIFPRTIDMVDA